MKSYSGLKNKVILYAKGFAMGSADIVPGVSGGTIALISGIYEHLIAALSSVGSRQIIATLMLIIFFWHKEKRSQALEQLKAVHWSFLIPLLLGIGTAILIMARIIPVLLENHPYETNAFFFGLILFSITIPFKKMHKNPVEFMLLLGFSIGAFILVGIEHNMSGSVHPAYVFITGAIAITAMILPGISGAYILLIFGQYKVILDALHHRQWQVIAVFMAGLIVGIFSFIRLLKYLLVRFHSYTMAALTGLMIGSLRKIWPPDYLSVPLNQISTHCILAGIGFAVAGMLLVYALEKVSTAIHDPEPPG